MPIHRMSFDNGIFQSKNVGYFDNLDGRMWANALKKHATNDLLPLVAIIDIVEVNRICPTLVKIMGDVAKTPNLNAIAFIVDPSMTSQHSRVIDKLSDIPNLRFFSNYEDAYRFAKGRLQVTVGSSVSSSFAYAFAF